jgi:hypothetical protein
VPFAPKRRWFQFSLRPLAASITLFAVSFGAWTILLRPVELPGDPLVDLGLLGVFGLIAIGCVSFFAALGVLFRRWVIAAAIGATIGLAFATWLIVDFLEPSRWRIGE